VGNDKAAITMRAAAGARSAPRDSSMPTASAALPERLPTDPNRCLVTRCPLITARLPHN
jgi:hypothetical protein